MEVDSDVDMHSTSDVHTVVVQAAEAAAGVTEMGEDESLNRRVYVGNLSWETRWQGLKDHMRQAGEVVHAEIFFEGQGRSAGCGIVEYETADGSLQAIQTLNDSVLDGRPIFVREDREGRRTAPMPAAGASNVAAPGAAPAGHPVRAPGGGGGRATSGGGGGGGGPDRGRKIVVWNLPFSVRWQMLKDHFRNYGNVIRADVIMTPDGKSKGMGTVLFETEDEAQRAINELSGTEMDGRVIDCRLDKFA